MFTFSDGGEELMQHDILVEDVFHAATQCFSLQGHHGTRSLDDRPQLFASFIVHERDTLLVLLHDQSVEEAAYEFIVKNALDMSSFDFIVRDLVDGLYERRRHREVLHDRVSRLRAQSLPLRVILGASVDQAMSPINHFGPQHWVAFSVNDLDILAEDDFRYYFGQAGEVDVIVAEHVFEHLDVHDAHRALVLCRKYLKQSTGFLRLAVPDWAGADNSSQLKIANDILANHVVQYNVFSLSWMLKSAGFDTHPREWQLDGHLYRGRLDPLAGFVRRSSCFDYRLEKISLVIDARPISDMAVGSFILSDPGQAIQQIMLLLQVEDVDCWDAMEILSEALTEDPCDAEALYLTGRLIQVMTTGAGLAELEDELVNRNASGISSVVVHGDHDNDDDLTVQIGTWLQILAKQVRTKNI